METKIRKFLVLVYLYKKLNIYIKKNESFITDFISSGRANISHWLRGTSKDKHFICKVDIKSLLRRMVLQKYIMEKIPSIYKFFRFVFLKFEGETLN